MDVAFDQDAWLAGFVDGEGSFLIAVKRQAVRRQRVVVEHISNGFQPRFQIGLRADDGAVLLRLRECFGGAVNFDRWCQERGEKNGRFLWTVSCKSGLRALVTYFDSFPLRAKKANDYAIWREAVLLYLRDGPRAEGLGELRAALVESRESDEDRVVALRAEADDLPRSRSGRQRAS